MGAPVFGESGNNFIEIGNSLKVQERMLSLAIQEKKDGKVVDWMER
jgi:hypothetical protein